MMNKQCFKVKFGLLVGGTIPLEVGAETIKKTYYYLLSFLNGIHSAHFYPIIC